MDPKPLMKVAKALADPTRFRILQAIAATGEVSCGELAEIFPIAQATVSHHLKILVESGLIEVRNEGQHHYYKVLRAVLADYRRALGEAFEVPKMVNPARRKSR